MTALPAWLIGQRHAADVTAAADWLQSVATCVAWDDARAAAIAAAQFSRSQAADSSVPRLIVFFLMRPGQIGRAEVEAIHAAFPLARLVALVGPWCEGEVRSGQPWPGVTRIYWHQWQPRLIEEVAGLTRAAARPLPRTASTVDVLLHRTGAIRQATCATMIGVVCWRQTDYEALAESLAAGGHHAVWLVPHEPLPTLRTDALVIDRGADVGEAAATLLETRSRLGPVPALLLCNFLRPLELEQMADLPAAAVMTKPFLVADLLAQLAGLLPTSASLSDTAANAAA